MTILSLCSGVGGLDLGLKLAVPESRVVAYVERDAYCQQVLRARMRDGCLDDAPIYDDLCTFDGGEWRGAVDLVCGGFPCQPHSRAGKRRGLDDERWLWPDVARTIHEARPGLCFLENVPGLFDNGAAGHVFGDLADLGYDACWGVFSACAVGAPHTRERVFILAHAEGFRFEQCRRLQRGEEGEAAGHVSFWQGEPQPERVAVGLAHRMDRIRTCGNGVVPLAAADAFRTLAARLT